MKNPILQKNRTQSDISVYPYLVSGKSQYESIPSNNHNHFSAWPIGQS